MNDGLRGRSLLEDHIALAERLRAALETPTGDGRSVASVDEAGVLRKAALALSQLNYTVGDFEVTVLLGPDNTWGVQLNGIDGEVHASLVHHPDDPGPTSLTTDSGAAAELADLLWDHQIAPPAPPHQRRRIR